jgi:hypothetical protein
MAHKVNLRFSSKFLVGFSDVEFVVSSDGTRVGVLKVSQGGVEWQPAREQHRYRMRWERFDEYMGESGRRSRSTSFKRGAKKAAATRKAQAASKAR